MFLPFIIFISISILSPSWGMMSTRDFETFIEPICFRRNDQNLPYINGQDYPLSSSMENFIALAEKFEEANPNKDLKDELFFFIRNFTYDNIEYNTLGDINIWIPKESNYKEIDKFWEPREDVRTSTPDVVDPFTNGEKCSLYFMLSHSIIRTSRKFDIQRSAGNTENVTTQNTYLRPDFDYKDEDLYPMEQGVVAIQGSKEAVDLGRVLTGVYVGLNDGRKRQITEFEGIPPERIPTQGSIVDPLYTLTIAEVIALAGWRPEAGQRQLLAKDGIWKSVPIGSKIETSKICPMIYRVHDGIESAVSYSSLRGAADGLILGKISSDILARRGDIKLSQILRQYYSRGGFAGKTPDLGYIHASFCNREHLLSGWDEMIKEQVHLFILLASTKFANVEDSLSFSWSKYTDARRDGVFQNKDRDTKEYCGASLSENQMKSFTPETPLDITVVLDSGATEENFKRQQLIIGNFAKRLSLSNKGSKMTIFTDQKYNPSVSTPGKVYLKTVVDQTYSSACAACLVTQIEKGQGERVTKSDMIIALNTYLNERNENQTDKSGVNGKVVILFDFEENLPAPGAKSAEYTRLTNALSSFNLNHRDASVYPLGKSFDVLKQYSRGVTTNVVTVATEDDAVAQDLYSKVIFAPARLQYTDCEQAKSEGSSFYQGYISPSGVQHWSMPAKYFHKSFTPKFTFESFNGPAKVCFGRDDKYPEREARTCYDLPNGSPYSIPFPNPCKGFTPINCSPVYISVIGVNDTETRTTRKYCEDKYTDTKCLTMDQIGFKISHEGIRCSGSMGILATPLVLLVAFILSHIFSKAV